MSLLTSEAVILRTWPVHEADLIVSFFTRDYGRVRGVAKAALKSRKRFGGALEPMTLARAWFAERPRQELVRRSAGRNPARARPARRCLPVAGFGVGADFGCRVGTRTTVDGAHLFLAVDDAPDGPASRHGPLHGLRRGIACSG